MVTILRGRMFSDRRFLTAISLLGGLVYLVQSLVYAHSQFSLLDEGAYLIKGYLYATGEYHLYQDYGPWANHMPLAFLVPGYAQLLFGPGLATGRYLAIISGVLSLLGLWILACRLGGHRWGALAVWALALNPALIKLYSLANSQALVASILVWVLVLTLGQERHLWQVLLGSALAGLMLLARINMAPVLGLLVLYLFWLHGWRTGLAAALAALLPVVIGHAMYWPGILRIWAHWLPTDAFTFLRPWGHPPGSAPSWRPEVTLTMRATSFFHGLRYHFLALAGAVAAVLFWPSRGDWKTSGLFKTAVFLLVSLLVMVLAHMWASLGQNYCVFCFSVYLSFFSGLGLLSLVVIFTARRAWISPYPPWLVAIILLTITTGIGFSAHADLGNQLVPGDLLRAVLAFQVPRIRDLQIQPGSIAIWGLLSNRYGLDYSQVIQRTSLAAQMLATTLAGLLFGVGLLAVARILVTSRRSNWRNHEQAPSTAQLRGTSSSQGPFGRLLSSGNPSRSSHTASLALVIMLLVGFFLSPTAILGAGFRTYDCGCDVIQRYAAAGAHLAQYVPAGSRLYWDGGDSAVPLLYLQDVEIYPAQINGDYSYRLGGDPDALRRYGFWSQELAHRWAPEADIILVEAQKYRGWLRELLESGNYDELPATPPLLDCRNNSEIHIFKKLDPASS
ncbi:MAG TPA: glycosyltransferase family 39 protein [Anaerolineales bacterium]